MTHGRDQEVAPAEPLSSGSRRLIVYALSDPRLIGESFVRRALAALRAHADRLVIIAAGARLSGDDFAAFADDIVCFGTEPFVSSMYSRVLEQEMQRSRGVGTGERRPDEVVLTGDGWFGPVGEGFGPVFEGMAGEAVHAWELIEQRDRASLDFAPQGFPERDRPELWLALRGPLVDPTSWHSADSPPTVRTLEERGYSTTAVFTAAQIGRADPALHGMPRLLERGCPVLPALGFTLYPPFLQQHAIIGREALDVARRSGFDVDEILSALARIVPPKALNTNLGLLDVLDGPTTGGAYAGRLAVVAHITDLDGAGALLDRVSHLPPGYDLFVTTTDGRKATKLRRLLSEKTSIGFRRSEVRVTPASRGRDMSDLFIACRDVLLGDDYDIVVKVHARPMSSKTRVVRSYFRRYQFDNLLQSAQYARAVLELFEREPGLGLVFPPTMHIGFQTMGRAWGHYRAAAARLAQRLDIRVPLDVVSPLAPFGGMFFARPAALRTLAEHEWTYRDYGYLGDRKEKYLARVQERLLVVAAAERGYHSRTVMTSEHAAISHTALEYKADRIFSTTSGYPVDQIGLLQRAGHTGRGGIVGLTRMYLRLNHPRISRVVLPPMAAAETVYLYFKPRASRVRQELRRGRQGEER